MLVIAHRGFRVGVIENTWDAFQRAIDARVDYIELDVHLTRDGELVVIHDDTINRIFDGTGRIASMDCREVMALRTRDGKQHLPRLIEVLEGPRGDTGLMIELKGAGTGEAVARLLASKPSRGMTVSSRHLRELSSIAGTMGTRTPPICFNITSGHGFTLDEFIECERATGLPLPFWMVSLRSTMVDRSFIERCFSLGVLAATWDFLSIPDPIARLDELGTLGIDAVLLDDPLTVEHARLADLHPGGLDSRP